MSFSLDLWASVAHAAIFISLILFPWMVGAGRKISGFLGFGGIIALIVLDFMAGKSANDMGLAYDLMTLTLVKAVFFFMTSLLIERVFRVYLLKKERQKPDDSGVDPVAKEKFDREMKSMKDRNEKFLGS